MVLLAFSGYFGVKRSSRALLLGFFIVALVSCIESILEAIYDIYVQDPVGFVTLSFCEALFFIVAMHYARFLWKTSRERDLPEAPPDGFDASAGYSLLGMRMLDIKVLKATQLLFTSLAIVASIFGSIVIRGAEGALGSEGWRAGWLIMFGTIVSLVFSGYFGVNNSNAGLLFCFSAISCTLLIMFGIISVLTALSCYGEGCWTIVFFGLGLTTILGIAIKNANFLTDRIKGGTILTAPVTNQPAHDVEPTRFGTELADVEDPVADAMAASASANESDLHQGATQPGDVHEIDHIHCQEEPGKEKAEPAVDSEL
jgi:hypothetical protein